MRAGDVSTPSVIHCSRTACALEAAKLMRNDHIGNVVVVDERDGRKVPLSIVTDRDVVVQLVAKRSIPVTSDGITVIDLMAREPFVALEEDIHDPFSACPIAARDGFRSLIEKKH